MIKRCGCLVAWLRRLSRRGAPVQNLAHSASFESLDKDAPSKAGTKQVALARAAHSREDWGGLRKKPREGHDQNDLVPGVRCHDLC